MMFAEPEVSVVPPLPDVAFTVTIPAPDPDTPPQAVLPPVPVRVLTLPPEQAAQSIPSSVSFAVCRMKPLFTPLTASVGDDVAKKPRREDPRWWPVHSPSNNRQRRGS